MSIKVMNWGWGLKLEPTPKLILMALADAADDEGVSWLKIRTIADKCNISERTVRRWIRRFQECGLLHITRRFHEDGRQTSNVYKLAVDKCPDNMSPRTRLCQPPLDTDVPVPLTTLCQGEPDTMSSGQEPSLQRFIEQPLQPALNYPRGLSKAETAMIDKLLQGSPEPQVLLDELHGAMRAGVIRRSRIGWFRAVVEKSRSGDSIPALAPAIAKGRSQERQISAVHSAQPSSKEDGKKRLLEIKNMLSSTRITAGVHA